MRGSDTRTGKTKRCRFVAAAARTHSIVGAIAAGNSAAVGVVVGGGRGRDVERGIKHLQAVEAHVESATNKS